MTVEGNIWARKKAQELYGLILPEFKYRDAEAIRSSMKQLAEMLLDTIREPEEVSQPTSNSDKMTDDEARRFGQTATMPRGKFQGELVNNVDIDYLIFWTEPDEFTRDLTRYLASDIIQNEQGDD